MVYGLLHCWSDLNKGDLGIIQATISGIRRIDKNALFYAFSCFEYNDYRFRNEHKILRQDINSLYPDVFGLLSINIGTSSHYNIIAKIIAAIKFIIQVLLVNFLPENLWKYILDKNKLKTIDGIKACDVLISKGGSYLTCSSKLREKIALFRIMSIFKIIQRLKKPYYILGQSLGPVHGEVNIRLLNEILNKAETVFLREELCIQKYKYINIEKDKTKFSSDIAFLLDPSINCPNIFNKTKFNLGLTVHSIKMKEDEYTKNIKDLVSYLITEKNIYINIFPQVSIKDDSDIHIAENIYENSSKFEKKNIRIIEGNYSPGELKRMYGEMNLFVGTRLHSTIFSIGMGIPSIVISYHGTKAKGIFEKLGLEDLVIGNEFKYYEIKDKIEMVLSNYNYYKNKCIEGRDMAINQSLFAIKTIVEFTKKIN